MISRLDHGEKFSYFNRRSSQYLKKVEFMSDENFRRDLTSKVEDIKRYFTYRKNSIDGLT